MSTQQSSQINVWNQTFENKSIAKEHRVQNKRTE